jgi:hypothetical protein
MIIKKLATFFFIHLFNYCDRDWKVEIREGIDIRIC